MSSHEHPGPHEHPGSRGGRPSELAGRMAALAERGVAFVEATVVRAQRPTSVRPGDQAVVHADGRVEGFVGGVCALEAVREHSRWALETRQPLLLRILPEDVDGADAGDEGAEDEGAATVVNPCLAGGGIEVFLRPRLSRPRVRVIGDTPIGWALAALGEPLGYAVEVHAADDEVEVLPDDAAVVVASHGRAEIAVLHAALEAGIGYVGLVASKARGAAVVGALGVDADARARVHVPAGLALGGRAPEETALSIFAEIVALRRQAPSGDAEAEQRVTTVAAEAAATVLDPAADATAIDAVAQVTAIDPVCGMVVEVTDAALRIEHDGQTSYFCAPGCQEAFAQRLTSA